MTQVARWKYPRWLYITGAICSGGTAAWDIATHGSVMVALVTSIATVIACFGAVFPKTVKPFSRKAPAEWNWFSRVAFATGFPSRRSLATRSTVYLAAFTLLQRFVLWPSAALAFDVLITISGLAIALLASWLVVRARFPH
jgi:hypothetical protein